jgi:photosynthetic reaction center cytochrome c subunit
MHHMCLLRRVASSVCRMAVGLLVGAFTSHFAFAQNQPLKAEEAFKNIQVLKGISAADFMGTMGIMTTALGFDCESCHPAAGSDKVRWEVDTPRKLTARRMVAMVTNINQTNFQGRQVVTCYTCHRGRDRPAVTEPIDNVYAAPDLPPDDIFRQFPGAPSADSILNKYFQALGGAQRVNALTSISATGKSTFFGGFGGEGDVQFYAKAPDQRATIITYKDAPGRGDSSRLYNGREGWMRTPLSVLGQYALSGSELAGARLDAQLTFPSQIKSVLSNLRVGEPVTVNGKDVQVVQGDGPDGVVASLYFDEKTGFLVRTIRYGRSPIGRISTQVDYDDYRDVSGVKIPFKYTFAWLDGRDSFALSDVRINVPLDAARFEKQGR